MVRSRGSYFRTLFMAAVEMVMSASAAGPPMSLLEKCPPNWMVRWRAPAQPIVSARSSAVSGRITSVKYSGIRVEDHMAQKIADDGQHDRSQKRRQKSLHRESRHEEGRQLQQEGIQDQPKQAQRKQGQWYRQNPQRPSNDGVDDRNHHRGNQCRAVTPNHDTRNNLGDNPQSQRAEQPVDE